MTHSSQGIRVGIVGSAGRYGRWLSRFFTANPGLASEVRGHDPLVANCDAAEPLADWADVLVFTVPVAKTVGVIDSFVPLATGRQPHQLWMDLTSIKVMPLQAMLASSAEVLGLHPMCAPPSVPTLARQRLVMCEGRLRQWRPWVEAFIDITQAHVVRMNAADHDYFAAHVQGLGHAAHLAQLMALEASGVPLDTLMGCATPTFQLDVAIGMRLLAGDPGLYAGLLALTPESRTAMEALRDACDRLLTAANSNDAVGEISSNIQALQAWAGAERIQTHERAYLQAIHTNR